jgi:hypothetical protein
MPSILTRASKSDVTRLQVVADYDLWFVEERLRDQGALAPERIPFAVAKFKYFIMLCVLGQRSQYVPCNEVDEVWHAFLLFTKEYMTFCRRIGTGYIHHTPHTSRHPIIGLPSDGFLGHTAGLCAGSQAEGAYQSMCHSSSDYEERVSCG